MNKYALMIPVALLGLSACVDPAAPGYTSTNYASQNHRTEFGTVIRVSNVRVQNSNSDQLAGTIIGGVAGAAVGNQFGRGSGKAIMTGAGAVGGAMLGSELTAHSQTQLARQLTVRLENGRTINVIQNDGSFRVGQHVRVVYTGDEVRIEG